MKSVSNSHQRRSTRKQPALLSTKSIQIMIKSSRNCHPPPIILQQNDDRIMRTELAQTRVLHRRHNNINKRTEKQSPRYIIRLKRDVSKNGIILVIFMLKKGLKSQELYPVVVFVVVFILGGDLRSSVNLHQIQFRTASSKSKDHLRSSYSVGQGRSWLFAFVGADHGNLVASRVKRGVCVVGGAPQDPPFSCQAWY